MRRIAKNSRRRCRSVVHISRRQHASKAPFHAVRALAGAVAAKPK
jgi:hypothetical protein